MRFLRYSLLNKVVDWKKTGFNTQKPNEAKIRFEKVLCRLLSNAFYGRTMEIFRNNFEMKFIEKDEDDLNVRNQSKLTFNGIPQPDTN